MCFGVHACVRQLFDIYWKKKPSEEPKNKVCKHNYAENACRPLLSHFGCILDCQELSHLVNSGTVCLKSTHLIIIIYR